MHHNEYLFHMFALEGERLTIYLRFWSGQAPTGAHERWMVCGQEKKVLIFLSHCYPHLVSYILTIQMHLPIYKSPSAIPSYLQSFHSFCPGESQGNTESARLDCCTSFPNFPFLYSWRKTREKNQPYFIVARSCPPGERQGNRIVA